MKHKCLINPIKYAYMFVVLYWVVLYGQFFRILVTHLTRSSRVTSLVLGYRFTLQWRHNGRDGISNHQSHDCLLNRLFRGRSKKTSKLRATGLCAGNSPGTGEFPAQMASNAENVSIWWRHHEIEIMEETMKRLSLQSTPFLWVV